MYGRLKLFLFLILACLAAGYAAQQADGQFSNRTVQSIETKTISTRLTGFSVPFKVDADDPSFVEVQLFLSQDKGKNWQLYDRAETHKKEFAFQSNGDGEYWFALRTLDHNRRLLPDGKIVDPELRVIVDTVSPELEFLARSDAAGRVVCSWRVEDENIDPTSVKILYRPAVDSGREADWTTVDVKLNQTVAATIYNDQIAWWPRNPSRELSIRFEIADAAGNVASAQREVIIEHVAQMHRNSSTAYPGQDLASKDTNRLPPNVVCKDGVCQIVDPIDSQIAQTEKTPAPTSEAGIFKLLRPSGITAGRRFSFKPVGSRAEYADPPPPPPDLPTDALRHAANSQIAGRIPPTRQPAANDKPDSIRWESKQEKWAAKRETHEGSTLVANQFQRTDIQPNQPAATRSQSVAAPIDSAADQNHRQMQSAPNQTRGESFVKQEGDLVISQSTAVGRGQTWNRSSETPATFGTSNTKQWKSKSNELPPKLAAGNSAQPPSDHDKIAASNSLPAQSTGFSPQASAQPTRPRHAPPVQSPKQQQIRVAEETNQSDPLAKQQRARLQPRPLRDESSLVSEIPADAARLIINSTRFRLNYDVQAIDPSGVGRVVLWMTRDGGHSWKSWATDPDNQSPFPVEVEEEGTYGFRVVIHSRDGLTGKAPLSGQPPDVWIHVDTTRPQVQITSAPYGRGDEAGKLIINWQAFDPLLTSHPIRLAYSTTLRGPWTTIADSLKNTGRYAWKVPSHVPERVYLRIEARDQARNASAHELASQIDLSGLSPRARIFSVEPVGQ